MLAQERFGKFTASEIWKLLVGGKAKNDIFGETAKTYIKEKAVEILTQRRKESFSSRATDWGNEWEYKAIQEYNRSNFVEVEYFELSQNSTTNGTKIYSMRFPRLINFRSDKDDTSTD